MKAKAKGKAKGKQRGLRLEAGAAGAPAARVTARSAKYVTTRGPHRRMPAQRDGGTGAEAAHGLEETKGC